MRRRYGKNINWNRHNEIRANLANAFKEFRKKGFLARMNFSCCSNCVGYELAIKAEELKDKGKEVEGCVFFHRQDQDSWDEGHSMRLRYGQMDTEKHGEIGKSTKEVGRIVCEILDDYGVPFKWNGDPNKTIEILAE